MIGIVPWRGKRVLASFLAVCIFAMAVFPCGNISYADTDINIEGIEGEEVVKSEGGSIRVVDEPKSSSSPSGNSAVTTPSSSNDPSPSASSPATTPSPSNDPSPSASSPATTPSPSSDPSPSASSPATTPSPSNDPSPSASSPVTTPTPSSDPSPSASSPVTTPTLSSDPSPSGSSPATTPSPSNDPSPSASSPATTPSISNDPSPSASSPVVTPSPSNAPSPSGNIPIVTPSPSSEVVLTPNLTITSTLPPMTSVGSIQNGDFNQLQNVNPNSNTQTDEVVLTSVEPVVNEEEEEEVLHSDFIINVNKVYKNGQEVLVKELTETSSYVYAKKDDVITIEFTQTNFTEDVIVKLGEFEIDKKTYGYNETSKVYTVSKKLDDEEEIEIVFDFYNGSTFSNNSCYTRIRYDKTPPKVTLDVNDGAINTNQSTILVTYSDDLDKLYMSTDAGENKNWSNVYTPTGEQPFEIPVNSMGTYYFYATDLVGNESGILNTDVGLGDYGVVVKKRPKGNENYVQFEPFSLDNGYLKFVRTFDEVSCEHDGECNKICLNEGNCTCCTKDEKGVCIVGSECTNYDYACALIPMNDTTKVKIVSPISDQTATVNEKGTLITLACTVYNEDKDKEETYNPSFKINVIEDTSYKIEFEADSNVINLPTDSSITSTTVLKTVTVNTEGLENLFYAWSDDPSSTGTEVYTATFDETIDKVFTYSSSDNDWYWDNEESIYRSGLYVPGSKLVSKKTITIDTKDTSGIISFEYKTEAISDNTLEITIGGDEDKVIRASGRNDWQTYSGYFTSQDGKFTLDLSFTSVAMQEALYGNYGAIRNLTFEGEKSWKELETEYVELLEKDVVGRNNYLYVKGTKLNSTTEVIQHSDAFVYPVKLESIEINTVPHQTLYDVSNGNAEINTVGGKITLIYDKGKEKIDMPSNSAKSYRYVVEYDSTKNEWVERIVKEGSTIDLSVPGVREIEVTYKESDDSDAEEFKAYYTVTVNYTKNNKPSSGDSSVKPGIPNAPNLVTGMIPVKWVETDRDGDGVKEEGFWITTTEYDTEWYDYSAPAKSDDDVSLANSRKWANVMLKDDIKIREIENPKSPIYDISNLAGKQVDSPGSMFVWIPRFGYTLDAQNVKADIWWSDGTSDKAGYTSQPAFTYGTTELTGFWIAKYEASEAESDVDIEVKPYRTSSFISSSEVFTVADAYKYSKMMLENYSQGYGISGVGTSHLVTMAEWDAVSLLSISSGNYGHNPSQNTVENGGSVTGYNGKTKVEFNSDANSSTTYNMYGVFDMHGGASEFVSAYANIGDFDAWSDAIRSQYGSTPFSNYGAYSGEVDMDALTFAYPDYYYDMEELADIVYDIQRDVKTMDKWLLSDVITSGSARFSSGAYRGTALNSSVIMMFPFEAVMRGNNYYSTPSDNGIFSTWVGPHNYYVKEYKNNAIGFRPSILKTVEEISEESAIQSITIEVFRDGVKTGSEIAGVGDTIRLTIKPKSGLMYITGVSVSGTNGTIKYNGSDTLDSGHTSESWVIDYVVGQGDDGQFTFEYEYMIQNKDSEFKDGPTVGLDDNEDIVYMDTTADKGEVGFEQAGSNSGNITVETEGGVDKAPIEAMRWAKKDASITQDEAYFENPDNLEKSVFDIDLEEGKFNIKEPGTYLIYIRDSVGNKSIQEVAVNAGAGGDGSWEVNTIYPKLEKLDILVLKNGNYVPATDVIKKGQPIQINMTFDYEVSRPFISIFGKQVTAKEADSNFDTITTENEISRFWIANIVPSSINAYFDIPVSISEFGYFGNMVEDITTETFDDETVTKIPYDGSLVKITPTSLNTYPKLYNKDGETWIPVTELEAGKQVAIEYEITFSSPVSSRDNSMIIGSNLNFESGDSEIYLEPDDITITTNMTAETIKVLTVNDAPEKRIIRFENVQGQDNFGFSIIGTHDTVVDLDSVTEFVAKNDNGNPNKYFVTTNGENMPFIDTVLPEIRNIVITSTDGTIKDKYAKDGDKIILTFSSSEELDIAPTVTIFGENVEATYSNGVYTAEYDIPAEIHTEGIVPFVISGYTDPSGNVGDTIRETDLIKENCVIYDRTPPVVTILPNDGIVTPAIVKITVTDDPLSIGDVSGVADTLIEYTWHNLDEIPLNPEWSTVGLLENNAMLIDIPTGVTETRYLIINGVTDKAGNTSTPPLKSDKFAIITVDSILTSNNPNDIAINGSTITINMTSNKELLIKPSITINCGEHVRDIPAENITGSGTNWAATYTVPQDESDWISNTVLGYKIFGYVCSSEYIGITVTNDNSGVTYKNSYNVVLSTSPDTVVDDTDPENIITTPGILTGAGPYIVGDTVTLTATASEGYRFDKWSITGLYGVGDLVNATETFTMPNRNVTGVASFIKTWNVVFKDHEGNELSSQVIDNGTAAVEPNPPSRFGYRFTGWAATPEGADYLNVTCDMELVATYTKRIYTINASAGSDGTITPSGSVEVTYNSNKRFNIAPNNGYKIADVIVDGVSVGPVTTYVFTNVSENHTIHVNFELDVRYRLEGEWYYDNIEFVEDTPIYVFRSRNTIDMYEDSSATIEIDTNSKVTVRFDYILNAPSDAMFGFTINGKPLRRVIESSETWSEFNEEIAPKNGKVIIGLTYSKGENPTEGEELLDLAAIKNLVVE